MRRDDGLALAALSSAVLALHRGSRDWPAAQFRPRACEMVDSVLPFTACLWGSAAAAGEPGMPSLQDLHTRGIDGADLQALLAGKHLDAYGLPLRAVQLEPLAARRVELCLWRGPFASFGEYDARALEFLMPQLVEAERENRLGRAGEPAAPARRSHAICDAAGELLQVDAQGLALLRQEWPQWRPPRLPPALCAALPDAVLPPARAFAFRGRHVTALLSRWGDAVLLKLRRRGDVDRLSTRQREIAERYAAGDSGPHIAGQLGLSSSTVNNHLGIVFRKLGVASKLQLLEAMQPDGAAGRRQGKVDRS